MLLLILLEASSTATKVSVSDRCEVFHTSKNIVVVEDFRIMDTIM